MRTITVIFVRT